MSPCEPCEEIKAGLGRDGVDDRIAAVGALEVGDGVLFIAAVDASRMLESKRCCGAMLLGVALRDWGWLVVVVGG